LPVGYFHVVFTLPAEVADIAWQNKAVVYDLLFRAAAETMLTIAADPKHLGARIGVTAVLHTWGSAMTHHPHVHMIVPGGGIARDASRWINAPPAFFLPVRVLGALFRRLFLAGLVELHDAGKLVFFGAQAELADRRSFLRHLAPLRTKRWVVYAKAPFAGPEAVLAYLSLYTHRVAISNRRLIAFDEAGVTFRYKDYRRSGPQRQQVMTLDTHEFMRRFLLHVLPHGFHRIRHYGLFASTTRKANIAHARELLAAPVSPSEPIEAAEPPDQLPPCPCCGGRMRIIETFERWMSRVRRHAVPQQPGRRRDPARLDPHRRRSHAAPANDRMCVRRTRQSGRQPYLSHAGQPSTPTRQNIRPFRSCRAASRQRKRGRWIQQKLQIPIGRRVRPAGSFLGDFRTPDGVRNSSR
jgi:hypothetical protein